MKPNKSLHEKIASFTPKKLQLSLMALELNPQVGEIIVDLLAGDRTIFSENIPSHQRSSQQTNTLSLFSTHVFEGHVVMISSTEEETVAHPVFLIGKFKSGFAVRTLKVDNSFYTDFINVLRIHTPFHVNFTEEHILSEHVIEFPLSELTYTQNVHLLHQGLNSFF